MDHALTQHDLIITAPDPRTHREAMIDLWAKTFGFGGLNNYFLARDFIKAGYLDGSHYDWDVSRIGVVDEALATHFGVWGYDMRVGRATIRCGGIGAVATHVDHRGRGHLKRTANASIDAMRDGGYDVSLLFGIDNFYNRFGYYPAILYENHVVPVGELPSDKPDRPVRKFKLVRREDTDRLYNQAFEGFTGTAVRPTFTRGGNTQSEAYRWDDEAGELAGYVYAIARDHKLHCHEGVGEPRQVLRTLGMLARKNHCNELVFYNQPRRSPLMRIIRAGRCEVVTKLNDDGGPMAKMLNLASTMQKVSGELHGRLKASAMSGWTGKLTIDDGDQAVSLDVTRRGIAVGKKARSSHTLRTDGRSVQLVFGFDSPTAMAESGVIRCSGEALALACALFPAQDPALLPFDHF